MTPILMIDDHAISKILIQYPIDPFSLAIGLQVKSHTKLKLGLSLLHKKCPKFQRKLGISITYNDFGHTMVFYPHVEKQCCCFCYGGCCLGWSKLSHL